MSKTQGEGRAPNEKSQRYVDPNLRKRKIKEQRDLTARFNDLCGEVTVTRITDDITMSHVPGMLTK